MKNKILVVAAHPDDEVLGCGGVMAKYASSCDIYIAILGEGISSRYEKKGKSIEKDIIKLQEKSKKVGKLLGAKQSFFFGFPDNKFDTIAFLDIVKKIEELIAKIKPEIIYTHHAGDLNIDHRITFQAVLTAARPIFPNPVKKIYSFEVLSSTEWSQQKIEKVFVPNVYEDIYPVFNKKIKALKIYKSEMREFPHPRSLVGAKVIAQKRGMEAGLKCAEAFDLIRWIK